MNSPLQAGQPAPDFSLPTTAGPRQLDDYRGRYLVLYFYPKDDTPGCTQQALAFTQACAEFARLGADILGVSRDPLGKHTRFIAKNDLGVVLASDEQGLASEAYGTWVEKSMYGRTYMGMARSTFLIAPDGQIVQVWPKVRVKDHVGEVLAAIALHSGAKD